MIKIIKIESSKNKNKRFKITMNNNKTYNFGLLNGSTYIDHNNKLKKDNYIKRHYNNPLEKSIITNMTISPSLFSLFILWGPYNNINKNIKHFNNIINKHHKFKLSLLYK